MSLLTQSHIEAYDLLVAKFDEFYATSTKEVKIKRRNPQKKWITNDILKLSNQKDKLWKEYKQDVENLALKEQYRAVRNKLTPMLRLAKKQYFSDEFSRCSSNIRKNRVY